MRGSIKTYTRVYKCVRVRGPSQIEVTLVSSWRGVLARTGGLELICLSSPTVSYGKSVEGWSDQPPVPVREESCWNCWPSCSTTLFPSTSINRHPIGLLFLLLTTGIMRFATDFRGTETDAEKLSNPSVYMGRCIFFIYCTYVWLYTLFSIHTHICVNMYVYLN